MKYYIFLWGLTLLCTVQSHSMDTTTVTHTITIKATTSDNKTQTFHTQASVVPVQALPQQFLQSVVSDTHFQKALAELRVHISQHQEELKKASPAFALSPFGFGGFKVAQQISVYSQLSCDEHKAMIKQLAARVYTWYQSAYLERYQSTNVTDKVLLQVLDEIAQLQAICKQVNTTSAGQPFVHVQSSANYQVPVQQVQFVRNYLDAWNVYSHFNN